MGRVFTTIVEFNGGQHVAMVTVSDKQGEQKNIQVQLFNKELFSLIPEGKFVYSNNDNALSPTNDNPAAIKLILLIKKAINEHLIVGPIAEFEKTTTNFGNDSNTNTPPH